MLSKSFKIPIKFLIAGILWAFFSDPVITFFLTGIDIHIRDIIRSANDFIFVGFTSVTLYFQIKQQQQRLFSSEEQYRNLFERNPNPMWIFRVSTLEFVKVSHSAVNLYGYSMDEFLTMNVMDIRTENEQTKLLDHLGTLGDGVSSLGSWTHRKKYGELVYVSILTYDLDFNGEPCRLVIGTDITDMILKEEKIKAQNAALHEIAWLNSHEVRKSLCSVMSLTALLKDASSEIERRQYIRLIEQCTDELDEVLMKTNKRVDELKVYAGLDDQQVY
ncbi:MAG: sensor protein [Mucilaginibacter sp.]|nr:sensor protein [Mucilaginibacter sp.]